MHAATGPANSGDAPLQFGIHRAIGGFHDYPNPGDLLNAALAACLWLEVFRSFYGPMVKAFGALDSAEQESLAADMIALAERFNRVTDGSLVAPSEYAEVVIKRR